ncbi:hypothetical protein DSO57_1017296 [Entomophthora muscae]|uniref:Uncharacterized protein n=1 Tax=Entomophthora muscae TaxID=34485 RepID=A0ACC2RJ92_9FUNG|nr:hypothetical protein DSO57_1017296 [Entomophthora muscae]
MGLQSSCYQDNDLRASDQAQLAAKLTMKTFEIACFIMALVAPSAIHADNQIQANDAQNFTASVQIESIKAEYDSQPKKTYEESDDEYPSQKAAYLAERAAYIAAKKQYVIQPVNVSSS